MKKALLLTLITAFSINALAAHPELEIVTAAKNKDYETIKSKVTSGRSANDMNLKTGESALMAAAINGDVDTVTLLLSRGADPNKALYENDETALMLVSRSGNTDVARHLINKGAQHYLKNKDGKTALDIAREAGNTDIVKLINAKISPSKDTSF